MKKVGLYTLGCKLNFSETSAIGRQFDGQGYTRVPFHEVADIYVINTCSVTDNADKKCKKVVRQALKCNAEAYIVIVGCYAQLKPKAISEIPGVDLVLGAAEKFRMFEVVDEFVKGQTSKVIASKISEVNQFVPAYSQGERTRSFLKIQDGCDYKCSFCTIPLARGKSRSDNMESILANAKSLAVQGVKEVVITGVNIGDYGTDQPGIFFDVVRALDEIEGIERFRISSIEPNLLTNEIIDFVAMAKRFMPHFHIPLQSGSNEMLKAMRRRYKSELYASRVAKIKAVMPHACIGVDVIIGFPGETEAHFLETYAFLNQLDVSYFHVFTYSERPNTHAIDLPNPVPPHIRAERSKMLRILSEKKRHAFYTQFLGTSRAILFEEEVHQGQLKGFTDNYIKVITPYDPLLVNEIRTFALEEIAESGQVRIRPDEIPVSLH
ncbi:MAG TPA: tRNA (N(6)-L-threonylcarbamoyladenosine(37)-C(2))-methylthiotransferase MtaB [Bacteroidetes bacterium]|nr:tRNA (N(6)-L-threonylcarbamoyladenosine(37)-C(2))-methylthiotransferase MtaB [Bacteroidota bacterium]